MRGLKEQKSEKGVKSGLAPRRRICASMTGVGRLETGAEVGRRQGRTGAELRDGFHCSGSFGGWRARNDAKNLAFSASRVDTAGVAELASGLERVDEAAPGSGERDHIDDARSGERSGTGAV